MERLIRFQNVKRYRRLLERVTEEPVRQTIVNLLAEEQQEQRDAGNPIQLVGRGTNSPVEHYTGGHGMSFCLEDQKPQPPEPPSPRWGFSFFGHFRSRSR